MATDRALRGSRRDLALVFSQGPRTAHEAGKALGKPTGAIYGVLKRMHAEGLLTADSEEPSRGTQYELSEAGQRALEHSADPVEPGLLRRRQQLLLVERPEDASAVYEVISDRALGGKVAWAAETAAGWLLALDLETEDTFTLELLAARLRNHGVVTRPLHVTGVHSGRELRARASLLLDAAGRAP